MEEGQYQGQEACEGAILVSRFWSMCPEPALVSMGIKRGGQDLEIFRAFN